MKLKMIPVLIVGLALACALSSTASADVTSSSATPAIPLRVALSATGLLFPDLNVWHRVKDWDAFDKASNGILAIKAWENGGGNNAKKLTGDDVVNFVENLRQAEKRNMIVIGYAFGVGGVSGISQADALISVFRVDKSPGHILVLDLEGGGKYGMTNTEAIAFVTRIRQKTGRYPFLYTSRARARPGALAKCPHWVAAWVNGAAPKGAIWQFTNGTLGPEPHNFPGVGRCDINKLLITYGAFRKLAGI